MARPNAEVRAFSQAMDVVHTILRLLAAFGLGTPAPPEPAAEGAPEATAVEHASVDEVTAYVAPAVARGAKARPAARMRLNVRFEETVDVAALRRSSSSSAESMRRLGRMRKTQRAKMLERFERAGVKVSNVKGFTLVPAVALTVRGADVSKLEAIDGVVSITAPSKMRPTGAKKPTRSHRRSKATP